MPDQITTKPFASQAQAGWAFATHQPFARRWARETGPYKKLPIRIKANYGAKRGQVIAGRLVRGEGGRFSSSGAAPAARTTSPKAPAARGGGKGRKAPKLAKPKITSEQRAAERAKRQQEALAAKRAERDRILADAGLGGADGLAGALIDAADGNTITPANGAKLAAMGLAEQARDGSYRLTASGRQVVNAAERGDAGRVRDTLSKANDRAATQRERQGQRISAQMARATQAKPVPAKGGGGSKAKPTKIAPRLPRRSSSRVPTRAAPSSGGGSAGSGEREQLPRPLIDAARALSDGQPTNVELLVRNGLAKIGKDGKPVLTAAGLRAIRTKSFAVFKDASGAYRWIARTTTAFEDRDAEVISTKALDDSAQSSAPRGPLRWWHLGRPNPLDDAQPWGPGVDLGWCDFAATHGRTLIESGTFTSADIARAVAAKADDLEISPGFFHAIGEPDASGVFNHIRIFERSLVPKWAGRASNRYTGLVVEKAMDQKKIEALKEMGIDAATLRTLLAEVETTEKAAEAEGVRYKAQPTIGERFKAWLDAKPEEAEPPPAAAPESVTKEAEPTPDPIADLTARLEALTAELATLKAGPAADAAPALVETQADDAMVAVETDADMPIEGDDMGGGEMSADEFIGAIGSLLDAKLGPLVEALGITTKLDGHMGELKSLLGGFVKQKDDAQAAQAARIDQIEAKVDDLTGDAPRAAGYRASQANDNQAALLLEALKENPDSANPGDSHPFADQTAAWFPNLTPR